MILSIQYDNNLIRSSSIFLILGHFHSVKLKFWEIMWVFSKLTISLFLFAEKHLHIYIAAGVCKILIWICSWVKSKGIFEISRGAHQLKLHCPLHRIEVAVTVAYCLNSINLINFINRKLETQQKKHNTSTTVQGPYSQRILSLKVVPNWRIQGHS